jgi:uncharacterized protein (TIGR01777 family)
MKVLISGYTGLIATEVARQLLERGDTPVALVRRTPRGANEIEWHPERGFIADGAMDGIDAVVNLAGATTGKLPWSTKYKAELIESRLASTRTLVNAINAAKAKPRVLVSGSASGFYGDTGSRTAEETDPNGSGFLAELAGKWELEAAKVDPSVRLVVVRTTMVMSRKLGALGRLLPLIKAGIGGPLGTGKQWWAWISLKDEAAAILHLMDNAGASGPYNLVAPEAATCIEVVRALGKELNRPTLVPAPAFALKLAFGEGADELLLCNQKLSAKKLLDTGFVFAHPTVAAAAAWVAGKDQ